MTEESDQQRTAVPPLLTHMLISSRAVLGVFFTTLTRASAPSTVNVLKASYRRVKNKHHLKRQLRLTDDTRSLHATSSTHQ